MNTPESSFVAFSGPHRIARGTLSEVAIATKREQSKGPRGRLALYAEADGRPFDIDLRGAEEEVLQRLKSHPLAPPPPKEAPTRRPPGRPKLGVVSREVSLLPRHWEWLRGRPGGASATLRKLVDQARLASAPEDEARRAIDATHNFMWDIAGDQPNFEEASRVLFARDFERFDEQTREWPEDIRTQLVLFTQPAREYLWG